MKTITMKKNIPIILLMFFLLITTNILDILWFFYNEKWIKEFNQSQYSNAYKNFKQADIYKSSAIEKYNIANTYYKQWNFQDALTFYNFALSSNPNCDKSQNPDQSRVNFCSLNYHNLGNTYYRLWEQNNDQQQKISLRNQAIENYKNALELKYDQETKKNLDFVQKKIDELKNQQAQEQQNQEDSKQQQDWQNNQSWSWNEQQNSEWEQNWTWYQENQTWNNSQEQNLSWTNQSNNQASSDSKSSDTAWEDSQTLLTNQQEQELKNYMEYLKQEEVNNQQYFNKKIQNSDQNDIFSQFFWMNPFFDNSSLNGDGEKDW